MTLVGGAEGKLAGRRIGRLTKDLAPNFQWSNGMNDSTFSSYIFNI
jgi:hypothetical protein